MSQIDRFINKVRFATEERTIKNGIAWLALLAEHRKLSKLRSTYTSFPTGHDGHVHTHYLVHGTTSGRLASRDPNLQNVPSDARKLFIPREGHVFVGRDYSNLELRIAAILSNDEGMLDAFRRGENLHDLNTHGLFDIVEEDKAWVPARRAAKIYVFGRRLYGGSQRGIYLKVLAEAPELSLTFADFQRFDAKFDSMYPQLAKWQRRIKAEVLGTKMVRNAFGRLRVFLGQTHEIEREGLNHPIQSTAADLINMATIRLHEKLPGIGAHLLLQIHDELVVECPEEQAELVSELMQMEMERPVLIDARKWIFPTEGKIGKDWFEL